MRSSVLQGELLFAEQPAKSASASQVMPDIVAAKATLKGLAHSPAIPDLLQEDDPCQLQLRLSA